MSNPLDPIWDAYLTSTNALKAVRRCATLPDIDPDRPFRNTRFHALAASDIDSLLDSAQQQMDSQVVLALYARFEAAIRDHIALQSVLLRGATRPDAQFGQALDLWFQELSDDVRMDKVVDLFSHVVGATLVAQVGSMRLYRHWLAHGGRGVSPPTVTPQFAFRTLSQFLQQCGLT